MKIYITASSGVGKTAVIQGLADRGYTAFDADDRSLDLTQLEIRATGEPIDWPNGYVDWSIYSWNANYARLLELLASNETVIVARFLGNQEKLYPLFDKLVALTIDPSEHELRLRKRPKREFGDDELNIQRRLEKYSMHMEKFIASGFIPIDNTGSIENTLKNIENVIKDNR